MIIVGSSVNIMGSKGTQQHLCGVPVEIMSVAPTCRGMIGAQQGFKHASHVLCGQEASGSFQGIVERNITMYNRASAHRA
jgi:hypothetical protein